ncbi:Ig-like domain-containing protein [Nitrincola sp.]|uniref:Ig-like domain-containing protein n=1 Tax=Nitrincola sp. TaxID=1926584 RepID=UPI003A9518A6
MLKYKILIMAVVFGLMFPYAFGDRKQITVDIEVVTEPDPSVHLSWDQQPGSSTEMQVTVYRRELGVKSGLWSRDIWDGTKVRDFTELTLFEEMAVLPPSVTHFTDSSVETGKHYEYRVYRPALASRNYNQAATYVAVSIEAPLQDQPGNILLVIDETLVDEMEMDFRLLELDLAGDGWGVTRLLTPPHGQGGHQALYAAIQAASLADPEIKGLYLFGKIPVARSGFSAPDGHKGTAHETDLYYADLQGGWLDIQLFSEEGGEAGSNIPRDGKYDHSNLPRAVDLMVGRVDMSRLTAIQKNEVELLRDYIHKTHAWRNGDRQVPYRALLNSSHLFQEHSWARTLFGPDNVNSASFQPELNSEAYLWAMDFGHWKGADSAHYGGVDNRALFFLNFGSGKQKWRGVNNPIRILLAQPDWGLAAGWGARPAWHMHQMAAGWPVGRSHQRTVNNVHNGGEFFPGGNYAHLESQVHINLMGDPTLRLHVAQPPLNPSASRNAGVVTLTWQAPPGKAPEGYHVYRSNIAASGYQRLTESMLAAEALQYQDNAAPEAGDVYYQIRAVHRNETRSGVYELASRAAYAWLAEGVNDYMSPVAVDPADYQATSEVPLRLDIPSAEATGISVVILQHPDNGMIRWEAGHPVYVSDPGFVGTETILYRLFDGIGQSETATLTITIM